MDTSREIRAIMSRSPVTAEPDASVAHVAWLLEKYKIGAVPIVAVDGYVLGIVTKGDVIGRGAESSKATEIMTAPVFTVPAGAPVRDVIRLMIEHGIGRLPVIGEDGGLAGIVSRSDLLAELLPDDAEIRRRVVDRVLDAGGEVSGARVEHGVVSLYGKVGSRRQIPLVEQMVREIDGVVSVNAVFTVCGGDLRELVRG